MFEFGKKLFDVEHSLMMHAHSYVVLPAASIYDKDRLKEIEQVSKDCHIYLIGHTPRIYLDDVQQSGMKVRLSFTVGTESVEVESDVPEGATLKKGDGDFRVFGANGEEYTLSDLEIAQAIKRNHQVNFHVLYIGQAYGKSGERAALDRLEKHETLQKIALQANVPEDSHLVILLLEIIPANRMMTLLNPHAIDRTSSDQRIQAGLDKLFDTSERNG
ncbi:MULTISPECIES: hypothetical protein [Polaromonas]|uniref:Tetrapyrrole methylase domain-containing protein n=1 Tax=Polaromonas aquatica TaxID=332657 RepID=A0ABW1U131_9BURK